MKDADNNFQKIMQQKNSSRSSRIKELLRTESFSGARNKDQAPEKLI
jgi:hypothetical protein